MTFGIPKTKEKFHIHHALWYTRYIPRFPRYATNTQVKLNPTHGSDPILTLVNHFQIFLYWWTNVVVTPVDFNCLSSPHFQHHFCVQFYHFRLVRTERPRQRYEKHIHGSTDCAGNSIHCVCRWNTSTQPRVVLNIINPAMQSYTQLQTQNTLHSNSTYWKYFIFGVKQCWPNQSSVSCHVLYKDTDTWPVLIKGFMIVNNFEVKQMFHCSTEEQIIKKESSKKWRENVKCH